MQQSSRACQLKADAKDKRSQISGQADPTAAMQCLHEKAVWQEHSCSTQFGALGSNITYASCSCPGRSVGKGVWRPHAHVQATTMCHTSVSCVMQQPDPCHAAGTVRFLTESHSMTQALRQQAVTSNSTWSSSNDTRHTLWPLNHAQSVCVCVSRHW
jgi:hypothetical protein